jgi:DNA-binding CsgD family transcriptional regulator
MPFPLTKPSVVMINNYPGLWQEQYQRNNYLMMDPTVRHATMSTLPVIWTKELFDSAPEMWDNANAHDLKHGWAQSSRDAKGVAGMLTFARGAECLTEKELAANESKMLWVVQTAHASMSKILTPQLMPESEAHFTPREIEILRWTADGKTASEIGDILSISVATVNFHINNAVAKLGAVNKTQAVVKAALLGILAG